MPDVQNTPYFITDAESAQREGKFETGLPVISEGLDSIRAYQFEMHFVLPTDVGGMDKLTLAAKQVTAMGFSTEDIEVHRVNDKVFYPGKGSPEEVTVTFDNFYDPDVAGHLWKWFSSIYNPMTGKFTEKIGGGDAKSNTWKAQRATVVELDSNGQPIAQTIMYGVYPKSWKTAEFNYSTNDFHTIEVVFRYDFMEQKAFKKQA